MTVEAALKELESILPGLNYVVFFHLHRVPTINGGTSDQYVAAALGPMAIVGGSVEVSLQDMLEEIESCIRWKGDPGSHPDEVAIRSPRLDELIACVHTHLENVGANSIWSFWLKEGHPDYPVQWEFAYVMTGPDGAEVFIGSSSD